MSSLLRRFRSTKETRSFRDVCIGIHEDGYASNSVSTSRYNILTFLPVNLFVQFMNPVNLYFLLIAVLQLIPSISLTGGLPTVAVPLAIVVIVNMIKDGIEDYRRHVSDNKENSQSVEIAQGTDKKVAQRKWKHVRVGDVVVVRNHGPIPADIVFVASSDSHGLGFVETSNLDGETNLKQKSVPKQILDNIAHNDGAMKESEQVTQIFSIFQNAKITCQLPNNSLYQFEGSISFQPPPNKSSDMELGHMGSIPLGPSNLLLRGSRLRNTEWAVGVVVYTGRETKIQMNSSKPVRKLSSMDKLTFKFTLIAFIVQAVFCLIGALGWGIIASSQSFQNRFYLGFFGLSSAEIAGKATLKFFSYIILFSNFVPISLPVVVGIVKIFQSMLIEASTSSQVVVRSSDLNEELGQVQYVFSDKTGTLTRNKLEFKKFCVDGKSFGQGWTEIRRNVMKKMGEDVVEEVGKKPNTQSAPNVDFLDDAFWKMYSEDSETRNQALLFFFSLAVNHSVVIEKADEESNRFSASSPDEGALVYAAKFFGFEFIKKEARGVYIRTKNGVLFAEQLAVFEFDSARKRSSVLCRVSADPRGSADSPGSKIFLFVKGADTAIVPNLTSGVGKTSDMLAIMEQYARDGLRTLCVAYKQFEEAEIADWLKDFATASNSMNDREEQLVKLAKEIETDLTLVGISGIEDKLQTNVGETIDALRQAGIKVWMLTGDKLETAVNIGLATSLLSTVGMYRVAIDGAIARSSNFGDFLRTTRREFEAVIEKARKSENHEKSNDNQTLPIEAASAREVALVIDGAGLETVLGSSEYREIFTHIVSCCTSVICCRTSPDQKGSIVRLIRTTQKCVTVAVGDGANDCNMIQAANIGIGINGEEGRQAFNASDYGITEFQALKELILIHGRWQYRRIAKLVLYMFYKNVLICLPSYFLNLTTALFSGQRLFEEYMYQLFNVIFTSWPLIFFGVLEQDLNKRDCLRFPQTYKIGQQNGHASIKLFARWMLTGLWHSIVVFYVPYCCMAGTNLINSDGIPSDVWLFGTYVYMAIMVVVSFKLLMESYYWNALLISSLIVSFGLWLGTSKILEIFPLPFGTGGKSVKNVNLSPQLAGVNTRMYTSPMTFFIVLATSVAALCRDFIFKAYRLKYRPKDYHIVMSSVVPQK
jgi:phospholipid-transporting ATPase